MSWLRRRSVRGLPRRSPGLMGGAIALGILPALLAIASQLALPALHSLHDSVADAHAGIAATLAHHADAHHHGHSSATGHSATGHSHAGEPSQPHHEHEESTCPTCQLFLSLRAFTPLSPPAATVPGGLSEVGRAHVYPTPFVARDGRTPSFPRAPPSDC
jgi:hypothetical protein